LIYNFLVIKDRVYGSTDIKNPVAVALLKTEPLLRLKKIAQFGVPDEYYHITGYSRLDHSIGVMILLEKLGASNEEQIAGLLHDVSHTAFSHTVDWVLGSNGAEDFQDERHSQFTNDPEMSAILIGGDLDPVRIFNFNNFGLLDSEIPDLCADRIDYALREFSKKDSEVCWKSLAVADGKIVFRDKESARLFADNFLSLQMNHWGGFEAVARWHFFAKVLKRALDLKIIEFEDFYKDDIFVIKKLKANKDKEIQKILKMLSRKSLAGLPLSDDRAYKKFRYVDPPINEAGEIKRLTEMDPDFANKLKSAEKANKEGMALPVLE